MALMGLSRDQILELLKDPDTIKLLKRELKLSDIEKDLKKKLDNHKVSLKADVDNQIEDLESTLIRDLNIHTDTSTKSLNTALKKLEENFKDRETKLLNAYNEGVTKFNESSVTELTSMQDQINRLAKIQNEQSKIIELIGNLLKPIALEGEESGSGSSTTSSLEKSVEQLEGSVGSLGTQITELQNRIETLTISRVNSQIEELQKPLQEDSEKE